MWEGFLAAVAMATHYVDDGLEVYSAFPRISPPLKTCPVTLCMETRAENVLQLLSGKAPLKS